MTLPAVVPVATALNPSHNTVVPAVTVPFAVRMNTPLVATLISPLTAVVLMHIPLNCPPLASLENSKSAVTKLLSP